MFEVFDVTHNFFLSLRFFTEYICEFILFSFLSLKMIKSQSHGHMGSKSNFFDTLNVGVKSQNK